ncbi:MAG: pyridoxamine 5'-phosphate oxidase family protein [Alcaligenes sp.]
MKEASAAGRLQDEFEVTTQEALLQLYGEPAEASLRKEVGYLHPLYQRYVQASPFVALATSGPEGLDVSPRGDPAGFVQVLDEKTLLLPDRRGNKRIDSLRNILHDPRVALLFLIPGTGETLRINGRATISTDPQWLERFSVGAAKPLSVLKIAVETVFFQCSRATLRARLWDGGAHVQPGSLPSAGTILEALSQARIDGRRYDAELPDRLRQTLY